MTPPRLEADLALDPPARLRLAAGEVACLDGPSSAEVVAILQGRRSGRHRIVVDGHDLARRGEAGRVRRGLVTIGRAVIAPDVTVRDHLVAVSGARRADRMLEDAPLLAGRGDDPAGILSGGERRVLAWLRAIALDPRVVVLDQAAEGLDTDTFAWAEAQVLRWRRIGVALVVRPGRAEERDWCHGAPSPSD